MRGDTTMIATIRTAAAGLLLLTALAACSANAGGPSGVATLESAAPGAQASAEPSASLDPEAARLAFAECMRDEGIDMPDPETASGPGGAGGFAIGTKDGDKETFDAALDACEHFLEQAAGERREIDPETQDRMLEFASCMRDHGIPMPDPNTDGGIVFRRNDDGTASSGDDTFDPSSPEFQEAQEACQPILGDDIEGPRTEINQGGGDGPGGTVDSAPEPAKP
jgi:hypothetical protein